MIEIEHVSRRYGDKLAVDELSFWSAGSSSAAANRGTLRGDFAAGEIALVLWSGERLIERSFTALPPSLRRSIVPLGALRNTRNQGAPNP